ncbi:MAG: hypothetical protein ACE14S_00045 [Candidatus Bathyarchaeia archaeon]
MPLKLKNLDFRFENSLVTVIANRNQTEIRLAGITIGPLQEGNEYQIHYWIAQELAAQGIVHFREEDILDATKLYKAQWKERVQAPGQISELPEDFYPKLRRYLAAAKREIAKQPEPAKVQEYEKTKHLANDIVNSRLKKIVTLSSGPTQTDQITKKLTDEEKLVYDQLSRIINEWRTSIIEHNSEA